MSKGLRVISRGFLALFLPAIGVLVYLSARYTVYLHELQYETVLVRQKDSLLVHLLSLGGFALISILLIRLCRRLRSRGKGELLLRALLALAICFSFGFSLYWVTAGRFFPKSDAHQMLESVARLRAGDYSDLYPDRYLGWYHQQLGIITIVNALYHFFAKDAEFLYQISMDYVYFEYLNCLCVPVLVFFGERIVAEFTRGGENSDPFWGDSLRIVYDLVVLCCFPLFFYTPWVYGEVISATMGFIFLWAAIRFLRSGLLRYFPVMCVSTVVGILARNNFWILLIAFCVTALLCTIGERKMRFIRGG